MDTTTINCKEACINGCVLGDRCPNLKYLAATQKFMQETSIDRILEIATNRLHSQIPPKDSEDSE